VFSADALSPQEAAAVSSLACELHSFKASLVIKATDIRTTKAAKRQPETSGPAFSSPFLEEVL
jgi:hypothetical protein